jgi:uncharacterized membrane protein YsdA (DUF1294 family)
VSPHAVELSIFAALNLIAFGAMGVDKLRAGSSRRRIPELRLIGLALVSGGVGSWVGVSVFRHKTRKSGFQVGLALASIVGAAGWGAWLLR